MSPAYLSLRPPKVMAPNMTPTKKMVAVALFNPFFSHTKSHFEKGRDRRESNVYK